MTSSTMPRLRRLCSNRVSLLPNRSIKQLCIRGEPLADWLNGFFEGLPEINGSPIHLDIRPQLTAYRDTLLSGQPQRGTAVHAGSFIRDRRIVLETELLDQPDNFRLILTHELFHFVWTRLGTPKRRQFQDLLETEIGRRAVGEIGESAAHAKQQLGPLDSQQRSIRWRNYVCESFCDTAARCYAGVDTHLYFRLAGRWQRARFLLLHSYAPFRI